MKKSKLKKVILFSLLALVLYVVLVPVLVVGMGRKKVYVNTENVTEGAYDVAIVFGAGVRADGSPSHALRDRLSVAAELYSSGKVKKLLVSGDNRFDNYNEPETMKSTLINDYGVPEGDIVEDFAGRRTFDTCIRAHEIWGLEKAILVSQGFHLHRAVFTCSQLGVESAGISASLRDYRVGAAYEVREFLAIHKAIIDLFVWEPDYVGGEVELDFVDL